VNGTGTIVGNDVTLTRTRQGARLPGGRTRGERRRSRRRLSSDALVSPTAGPTRSAALEPLARKRLADDVLA
jgi:hypothetical protein